MTSNIQWALIAGNHTAHPQFNYPFTVLDDYFVPSFVLSDLQLLPASSLPADDLHREIEAIRGSSSSHYQTSVPTISAFSPVMMLHLCVSPSRTAVRHPHSFPSLLHHSHQQNMWSFPQPKNKQKPLDPKASFSTCPFLYSCSKKWPYLLFLPVFYSPWTHATQTLAPHTSTKNALVKVTNQLTMLSPMSNSVISLWTYHISSIWYS